MTALVSGTRQRLRAATADLHARVDALFPDGLDSADAYRRYVLGMHRFAVDHEVAIDAPPRQSSWLSQDLVALSLLPLPPLGRRVRIADPFARIGWAYVMAGSAMGARALLRDARRLGFDGRRGARFLERHADGDEWEALQPRLAALDAADEDQHAALARGARDAFACVHHCFTRSLEAVPTGDGRPLEMEKEDIA